jgi:hypothetical protein
MTTDEWQKRLEDTFTVNRLVGGYLVEVHEREARLGRQLVQTYQGQNVLIDSFQSFFIESLNLAIGQVEERGWPNSAHYPLTLAYFNTLFRRYRAGEVLFYSGYPLDGYTLLRDIKDRALLLCGVLHRLTTIPKTMGMTPALARDSERRRNSTRVRKDEENKITRLICGVDSGLPPHVVAELKSWDDLFHDEVHGARLSFVHELDLLKRGMVNRVGPTFHQQAFAVYMNRVSELGWLILRLLPYLQMGSRAFGDEWSRKYSVLDDSFRIMVQGLSKIGKQIGEAFIALVDAKFNFGLDLRYFDPGGTV